MSTTRAVIGEHDVVALINPVERWPAGTEGTVVSNHPAYKTVEIVGIEESGDDMLDYLPTVATEDLRLVWKAPPPSR
ncbi:MAG: hypothetical protein JSU06_09145 [Actinobacteria bacterium]|nr:hypothetical protein [Actinomycetota bacterium]